MKKLIGVLSLCIMSSTWAAIDITPLQNKITLQLQAEQWVTTKTALVSVSINAAVTDQGIGTVQATVMQKLKQLSDQSDWHIVAFNRQEDKTGLENVLINAEARLPQTDLANLRSKAKSISKPGETYTIDNVQFTPSDAELKAANLALRSEIYQQAKTEIDAINKLYPEQKYYLHAVDFLNRPMPMMRADSNMMMAKMASASMPEAAPLNVGNKAYVNATIEIASLPPLPQLAPPATNAVTQKN